jgi:pyruvate dehydrogenase E1 component alpha subunit
MAEMIAEIYGKESGCSRGRGGSMHLISPENGVMGIVPIVSGTISLALGAALSIKIKKEDKVPVSFFGDGATGEGVLYESLNFAALKKLPIIFACENNLYSTHLPINEIRTNRNIFNIADPFEIQTYRVDGNDVLEVFEVAQKAVECCRSGCGPVFIEFLTYRLRGHVGPDDNIQGSHTDIRPKEEIEAWTKRDPIKLFKEYLIENVFSTEDEFEFIRQQVEEEVKIAFEFATGSPKPNKEDLCKYVFKK